MPRRPLITERDIRRAAADGKSQVDVRGALVTPSAIDEAARRGVTLDGLAGGASPAMRARTRDTKIAPAVRAAQDAKPSTSMDPAKAPNPATTPRETPRVVIGADHGGVPLKDTLLAFLRARGHAVEDVGAFGADPVDYPDFAVTVANVVVAGRADVGIMIDGAGIGSCMAANKVAGARAAMCYDVTTAANAREHNNANVLTLGGTLIGGRLAQEIVATFLGTAFGGGRHARRVEKIDALDAARTVGERRDRGRVVGDAGVGHAQSRRATRGAEKADAPSSGGERGARGGPPR
jgi:ribose 5-phosphate isomerase B